MGSLLLPDHSSYQYQQLVLGNTSGSLTSCYWPVQCWGQPACLVVPSLALEPLWLPVGEVQGRAQQWCRHPEQTTVS